MTMAAMFFKHMKFFLVPRPADLVRVGVFEGVVCSEVLEHTADDAALAEALLRITAGTLAVTTPWTRVSDPGHLRVYTERSLRALFERPSEPGDVRVEMRDKFLYLTYARTG